MTRKYYAAASYMGLNYTWDSPCWNVYVFESPKKRDAWVDDGERRQRITRKTADKIGHPETWEDMYTPVDKSLLPPYLQ